MQKLSNLESFKNFEISKSNLSQINGARTVTFGWVDTEDGSNSYCGKQVDDNNGEVIKTKVKIRYEGRC